MCVCVCVCVCVCCFAHGARREDKKAQVCDAGVSSCVMLALHLAQSVTHKV